MTKLIDKTIPKFLLVGVINTLAGCGTMFALYNWVHCSYWFSSAMNYIAGGIVSFFLNKYFTFQNNAWQWKQIIKFVVNVSACYIISYIPAQKAIYFILSGYSLSVRDNMAMFCGMCLYTVTNYAGQRFWIFIKN